jgi:S1-C subfamily serine protease
MNWRSDGKIIFTLILGCSIGVIFTHFWYEKKWNQFISSYSKQVVSINLEKETDFTTSVEKAIVSTVSIKVWKKNYRESTGAGVIFDKLGHIITNYHVIKDAETIEIELYNHVKLSAELKSFDEYTDLAVLKIQTDIPLNPIVFGNSDEIRIGQWVIAIGNPYHLHSTVTKGIISGLGRDIGVLKNQMEKQEFSDFIIESFIQTDAPINPGNSGGPLVNLQGQMIGINTAIASESGYFEGFGFAIPANLVLKIVKDLIQYGKVKRSFLGIQAQHTENPFFYKKLNTNGLEISSVSIHSPAFKAGLLEGDIILAINDKKIQNFADLKQKIATFSPKETVSLQIFRNDQVIEIHVVLEELNTFVKQ